MFKLLDTGEEAGELLSKVHLCAWLDKKFAFYVTINLDPLQVLNKDKHHFKENSKKGRIEGL